MSLPTGQISISQIAGITHAYNLGDGTNIFLAGGGTNMGSYRGRPYAGSFDFNSPPYAVNTWYTFICPAYKYFYYVCNGAGGGGGGGDNHNVYGIGNSGYNGGDGGTSYFNFPGYEAHGYGGAGGGGSADFATAAGGGADATGGYATLQTGVAGNGGAAGAPQQGGHWGGYGGAGGQAAANFTFRETPYYPPWGSTISVYIGRGGDAAPQNAGPGGNGRVYGNWS